MVDDNKEEVIPVEEMDDETFNEAVGIVERATQKAGADGLTASQRLGVLQRLVRAETDIKKYQQNLLTALFENKEEAMLAADAISERQRYGVDITPILTRISAQCGIKGERVKEILDAMSHYTLNTNYPSNKTWWQRRNDSKSLVE